MPTPDELLERFFYRPDEVVGPLLQRVPAPAVEAAGPAEQPAEFLAFALGEQLYAVPIAVVREIVKVGHVTEVPRAPPNVIGLINVRGEMLPLYDVRARLALAAGVSPPHEASLVPRGARVVLVRDPAGDAGVLVDRVHGVVSVAPASLAPLGGERVGVPGLDHRDGPTFLLLDLGQVLS